MAKKFEEKFAKIQSGGPVKNPTEAEKTKFSQAFFQLESAQLGHLVRILDDRCESSIDKSDPEEIEIDIDAIDPASFRAAEMFMRKCIADKKAAAGGGAGGGQQPPKKRAKVGP